MGLWDKIKNPGTIVAGPAGGFVWDAMDLDGKKGRAALGEYESAEAGRRASAKQTQYDLLGRMKAPKLSMQQEARIKALEDESKLGLEQDPNFQSQLRQARVGGSQSLASVQNNQAATGAGGGFTNVGSAADVYDRLGVQLADLAGQQQQFREEKRDRSADMRQSIMDAQTDYDNSIIQAQIAIESGDAAAAQQALAAAYQARSAIQNAQTQKFLGIGGLALGALTANPGAAAGGAQNLQGASAPVAAPASGPTVGSSFGITPSKVNQPYYSWRS